MSIFQVHFTISQLAVSGIKVNRLDMYGEVLHVLFTSYLYNNNDHVHQIHQNLNPLKRRDVNWLHFAIQI